jgi:hypothetical protein
MFRFAGFMTVVAVLFSLEYWLRVAWYAAIPLGMLAYGAVRYSKF